MCLLSLWCFCFHTEFCLWCVFPPQLFSLSGQCPFCTTKMVIYIIFVIFSTLWRLTVSGSWSVTAWVILKPLSWRVLLNLLLCCNSLAVFNVKTLQNCGFVMCFCFVSFQLSSHIKVQSHSALSYILFVLSFFHLTFLYWFKKHL